MAYRKCPNHGWLDTSQYTVDESGETICPACEIAVSNYRDDEPRNRNLGFPMVHEIDAPASEWSMYEPCTVCGETDLHQHVDSYERVIIDEESGAVTEFDALDEIDVKRVECPTCESVLFEREDQ